MLFTPVQIALLFAVVPSAAESSLLIIPRKCPFVTDIFVIQRMKLQRIFYFPACSANSVVTRSS